MQQGLPVLVFLAVAATSGVLWYRTVRPVSFVGQVELIQVSVNSRDAGLLTNLWVTPLQEVKAGDVIGEVVTTDPRTVNNRLEVMRDRMRLTELEMTPALIRQRSAVDYEQLVLQCARSRVELAMARANLSQASNEFRRVDELHRRKDRLVSDTEHDLAKARWESLQSQVEENARLVGEGEKALQRLSFMADTYLPGGENDPVKQALAVEEEKIKVFEQRMKPLPLVAPIDGIVTALNRRAGEQVLAGEAVVAITSKRADRIVAFVPRSSPITPRVGMGVAVSTRKLKRETCEAQIIGVGPHVEGVTNAMILPPAAVQPVFVPAIGRPISISLPPGLDLLPGELVDLRILRGPCGSTRSSASR
jgi:multidrug resistance efflux pump